MAQRNKESAWAEVLRKPDAEIKKMEENRKNLNQLLKTSRAEPMQPTDQRTTATTLDLPPPPPMMDPELHYHHQDLSNLMAAPVNEPVMGAVQLQEEALTDVLRRPSESGFEIHEQRRNLSKIIYNQADSEANANSGDTEKSTKSKEEIEIRKLHKLLRLKEQAVKDAERARSELYKSVSVLKAENSQLRDQDSARERHMMEQFYREVKGKIATIEVMANSLMGDVVAADKSFQALADVFQPTTLAFQKLSRQHFELSQTLDREKQTTENLNQVVNGQNMQLKVMAEEVLSLKAQMDTMREEAAMRLEIQRAELEQENSRLLAEKLESRDSEVSVLTAQLNNVKVQMAVLQERTDSEKAQLRSELEEAQRMNRELTSAGSLTPRARRPSTE